MLSVKGRVKFLTSFTRWVKLNSRKGKISLLVQFLLKKGETKRKPLQAASWEEKS
jgi:hypothetical protein